MEIHKLDTIKLDGRVFTPIAQTLTMAQHDYVQSFLRDAGAELIIGNSTLSAEEKSLELYRAMERAGVKQQILAGVLTEVGKKWSRAEADRNAEIFDGLTSREDRMLIHECMLFLVTGFFLSAEASSRSSLKSSPTQNPDRATSSAAASSPETSRSSRARSRGSMSKS